MAKEKKEKKNSNEELVELLMREIPNTYDSPPSRALNRVRVEALAAKIK